MCSARLTAGGDRSAFASRASSLASCSIRVQSGSSSLGSADSTQCMAGDGCEGEGNKGTRVSTASSKRPQPIHNTRDIGGLPFQATIIFVCAGGRSLWVDDAVGFPKYFCVTNLLYFFFLFGLIFFFFCSQASVKFKTRAAHTHKKGETNDPKKKTWVKLLTQSKTVTTQNL